LVAGNSDQLSLAAGRQIRREQAGQELLDTHLKRGTVMSKRRSPKITPEEDAQSVAFFGLIGGFFLSYLGAEVVIAQRPHPLHWLAGGVGAVLAGGVSYGLTLWRRTH
jgi:hypothetical protein